MKKTILKPSAKPSANTPRSFKRSKAKAKPKTDAPLWHKKRSKINGNWFKDRIKDQGLTLSHVADELGVNKSAITLMLQGKRLISLDEAGKIARLILKPLDEVLKNAGVESSAGVIGSGVLVAGWVGPAMEVVFEPPSDRPRAPVPTGMSVGTSGLRVLRMQTSGSQYEAMNGALLYYIEDGSVGVRSGGDLNPTFGKIAVIRLKDRSVVGVLKRSFIENRCDLYSMTGELLDSGISVLGAHLIFWMRL